MIHFCVVQSLVCFQTNVTVSLDVQTRSLIFKAWPRTDQSAELNVCKQLSGDLFQLSIQTGAYTYVLSQLQKYDIRASINVIIPCNDSVNKCSFAFKASSAIYIMRFQNTQVEINEAVQNLRRVDFNRKDCVRNPELLYGQNVKIAPGVISNVFKFSGTPTQICKYPLDSVVNPALKKALILFFAYPDYIIDSPQNSIPLSTLIQQSIYPCVMMPTPERVQWCNNMIQMIATESFAYNQVQYFVPGKIPNRNGTITRETNYTITYETNVVTNTLQSTFDCYSSQNIMLYSNTLLLTNTMNPAINYCNTTMSSFIGVAYDKVVTRVIFQEFEDFRKGNVYILDFNTKSQVLNSSSEWLDCNLSTNTTYCMEVLALYSTLKTYKFSVQQLIYNNGDILKIFPLSPSLSISCLQNASAQIQDTQACVSISKICSNTTNNKQFTFSFSSSTNTIILSTYAQFPNSENNYCVDGHFTRKQAQEITGGTVKIDQNFVPIITSVDKTDVLDVQNIQWIIVGVVTVMTILVVVGIFKPFV
ncbi:Conserved_hypothetical protein [Hexamita inflata]|uniref:Uncharacterized protein n=1 Tax=Hexamita inflata TaxID=28002 RepID=A0AA86PZU4_9EUKA|nr:Conserved hypothetical protein [Hexamita inflata]